MKPLAVPRRGRGEPLRRRRQVKTRRRWTWRSLLHAPIPQLVALLLVLGGLYGLATSRLFSISTVQAVGDSSLTTDAIRAGCECVGANIFLTRPEDVRARLTARLPWIDVRQVYTRLPDRLVVDATDRRPALLWRTTAATYTVDMSGRVLYDLHAPPVATAMIPTTATVPLVYSPHDVRLTPGQFVPSTAIKMVMQTRADLPASLAPSVNVYRWSPYSGLTAHSTVGWWFSLGIVLGDDLRMRVDAVSNAYKQGYMDQHHCNYVDLRPGINAYCNYQLQWHWPLGPGTAPARH